MANVLSDDEVDRNLPDGWEREGSEIARTYEFEDYLDGVTFANAVAEVAEEQQHHPKIVIEFRSVTVRYTTHDVGGITRRDLRSAGQCNDEY